jgi:hypothetical protein
LFTVNQLQNAVFIPVKESPMLGLKVLHLSQILFEFLLSGWSLPCFSLSLS